MVGVMIDSARVWGVSSLFPASPMTSPSPSRVGAGLVPPAGCASSQVEDPYYSVSSLPLFFISPGLVRSSCHFLSNRLCSFHSSFFSSDCVTTLLSDQSSTKAGPGLDTLQSSLPLSLSLFSSLDAILLSSF